jgi:hypothetical protein
LIILHLTLICVLGPIIAFILGRREYIYFMSVLSTYTSRTFISICYVLLCMEDYRFRFLKTISYIYIYSKINIVI